MSDSKEKSVILSIRGLKKSFGALEVLKGVDLDIKNGEKIVLLGPSFKRFARSSVVKLNFTVNFAVRINYVVFK